MPSYPLYMISYAPFMTTTLSIHDITCTIYDMSSTVYDIPFTICVTSHNACISDITQSMFMTYPLYMASHIVLWKHSHCVTSQPLCLTSPPLYQFYQTQCMDDITASKCMTSYALYVTSHQHFRTSHHFIYASSPLYLNSHPVYMCHPTQIISDITDNIYMTSHPV